MTQEETEPLPVTLFKEELMKAVRASQVLVCTGETGSGKTTQIPQYLLELVRERDAEATTAPETKDMGEGAELAPEDDGNRRKKKSPPPDRKLLVAVTQPRRVAATSVARRVADERGCRLGEEVGYSIRFEDRTGPRTRIKYMTDGVLVRECLQDPYLSRYGVVMLDEAHERSIDTDILFGLLKRALARRPDMRAVITSATLDVERFAAFFGGCPSISVPGRTHAVDVYHSKTRQVTEGGLVGTFYSLFSRHEDLGWWLAGWHPWLRRYSRSLATAVWALSAVGSKPHQRGLNMYRSHPFSTDFVPRFHLFSKISPHRLQR